MLLHVWLYDYEQGVFNQVRIIDDATSVIWVTRYNKAGEFEIYLPADNELIKLFSYDGVIITRDDTNRAMYVEKLKLTTSAEDGDYLTISGRSVECILGRRVIPQQTIIQYPSFETGLYYLIYDNVINPSDAERKISFIRYASPHGWNDKIDMQITGKNLLTAVEDICTTYDTGFKLYFTKDAQTHEPFLRFDLYRGVDRSLSQNENTRVIFSPEFENLGNTEYSVDRTQLCNWCYVAGEGEGNERKIREISSIIEPGLYVFERWVDARGISSNDGEISASDYTKMLVAQGNEEIENSKKIQSFSGEILNVNAYKYGVDYNLGDKVSIVNEYGIRGDATITEISEIEDETGYRLIPTLSEWSIGG